MSILNESYPGMLNVMIDVLLATIGLISQLNYNYYIGNQV